jgi:HSP20 family protein
MTLIRRTPYSEFLTLRDTFDRLFDETIYRPLRFDGKPEIYPLIDLYTTPEFVMVEIALPGIKPEKVELTMTGDVVTISGIFEEPKEVVEGGYIVKEIFRGKFSRSFTVPTMVKFEEAKATFKEGLLYLELPKAEHVKPKHLKVLVK